MQIVSSLSPLALEHEGGTAVAMGYFDGIHIGHRAVIEGAVEWAKAHGAAPAVFTFKLPADSKMKGRRLLSTEDKHALIASLGVEYYLCPEFEEIRAMTPGAVRVRHRAGLPRQGVVLRRKLYLWCQGCPGPPSC